MRPRGGEGVESDSQTLILPEAAVVIASPRDDVFQFSQTRLTPIDSTPARGKRGGSLNISGVTASAAGPTKTLRQAALI